MTETIHIDIENGVFSITLERGKANALNLDMIRALQGAFKQAAQQPEARVVLLRGAGNTFSGGQDVYEILEAKGESYRKHMLETYNPLVMQIRQLEMPVLAEIRGTSAGAALGLALACDLRIASEDARFVVGFLGIGLALDSGVSLFLPALIGLGRAVEAAFSNQPITAQQALSWGLVNQLVPAELLQTRAVETAQALAMGPVHAMGLAKRNFNKAIFPHLAEVLDYEAHLQEVARAGAEHREGVSAFVEKRMPYWEKR